MSPHPSAKAHAAQHAKGVRRGQLLAATPGVHPTKAKKRKQHVVKCPLLGCARPFGHTGSHVTAGKGGRMHRV